MFGGGRRPEGDGVVALDIGIETVISLVANGGAAVGWKGLNGCRRGSTNGGRLGAGVRGGGLTVLATSNVDVTDTSGNTVV